MASFRVDIVFLLFSIISFAWSTSSGQQEEKPDLRKLAKIILNNPFLKNYTLTKYEGNPFLSNRLHPSTLRSNKFNESHEQSVNNSVLAVTEHHSTNIVFIDQNLSLEHNSPENDVALVPSFRKPDVTTTHEDNTVSVTNVWTQTKTKSEIKCEEYIKKILGTKNVLVSVTSDYRLPLVILNKCNNRPNRLVSGGVSALPGEFPHMVAIGRLKENGTFHFSCGGTLIAPQWVLTAAHCTHGPRPKAVRIGVIDINVNQQGVTANIIAIERHSKYNSTTLYADIALLKLDKAVSFSDYIKPACIYPHYDTFPLFASVSGWGAESFGDGPTDSLKVANLTIIDNIACTKKHKQSTGIRHILSPSMICAGDPDNWTKDTCQGDSGGPLQIRHPNIPCFYQVLGITSYGYPCALSPVPGVYTRVSHYLTWIEDIVWP